ncbi:hypothetical protein EUGRSUZ_E01229 [Eucalyptus grandis]|uniref:Uncharacterized protein n=2 Tax=Eucalyptus grandis TaxID=71139 RepID=A0ACC3KTG6_EUCGR|nr:hypothetical protein EUGRSUZ_E01229 [Eucalyptus grandis]
MESLLYALLFRIILLLMIHTSLAKPLCHPDESSALMEFKRSFRITTAEFQCVCPTVESWLPNGHGDCCSWDGVECNEASGHVTGLDLSSSCLLGNITSNTSLVRLLHLESLNLSFNDFNSSSIPYGFGNLSRLQYLNLSGSEFSGKVPSNISQLSRLTSLDLSSKWASLEMPSIENFVQNLTMLRELDLSIISMPSPFPHILANFSSLKSLVLRNYLSKNNFTCGISHWLVDLPKLNYLNLSGEIPNSLWELEDLEYLALRHNNLSGTMDLNKLKNLTTLLLDFNNISFVSNTEVNATLPKLSTLSLVSCNLHEFPRFLGYLNGLEWVDLSNNKIKGSIPTWMWNGSKETLMNMDLSHNFLTDFGSSHINLPMPQLTYMDLSHNLLTSFLNKQINLALPMLTYLDISSNLLKTTLPSPPLLAIYYNISNNNLFGEIQSICRVRSLVILDLSINSLNGTIPSCLGNIDSLTILNLGRNKLEGMIPNGYLKVCVLKIIDLTNNRLQGPIPRSLINCPMLEYLNLGYNQIHDGFPSWLSKLTKLRAIILKSNKFYGPIETYQSQFNFSNLHIMDLSNNAFIGELPSKLLQSFHAMKVIVSQDQLEYMNTSQGLPLSLETYEKIMDYDMKLMSKGTENTQRFHMPLRELTSPTTNLKDAYPISLEI